PYPAGFPTPASSRSRCCAGRTTSRSSGRRRPPARSSLAWRQCTTARAGCLAAGLLLSCGHPEKRGHPPSRNGTPTMPHRLPRLFVLVLCWPLAAPAAYDYFEANRETIRRGVQAMLMCNGLFTSERTLEQVFAQELAYLEEPIGDATGGAYTIRRDLRGVAVGTDEDPPVLRAVFREGLGCVAMAPDQDWDDADELPRLDLPPPPG